MNKNTRITLSLEMSFETVDKIRESLNTINEVTSKLMSRTMPENVVRLGMEISDCLGELRELKDKLTY